jgi:hypothetical protein
MSRAARASPGPEPSMYLPQRLRKCSHQHDAGQPGRARPAFALVSDRGSGGIRTPVPCGTFAFKVRAATCGSGHGVHYFWLRVRIGVTRTVGTGMNEMRTETSPGVSAGTCPQPTRGSSGAACPQIEASQGHRSALLGSVRKGKAKTVLLGW